MAFLVKRFIFRGGEWSFKNPGSRKILVEFHGSRSLVFLSVMCVSQSRFLFEDVSESRFFRKAKGLEVPTRLFAIFLLTSSRHSILNFIKATCSFQEKVNPNFS